MSPAKLLYKPIGLVTGVLAGVVAGQAFRRAWKRINTDEEPPKPLDEDRRWPEVLVASALEGATFAVIRAAVERGGATAFRRSTGVWPG
ncbi:DUF4235 domain-containing protein [Streptomyces sp. NPDC058301]|uniref:DUF4235 domain-containing protein n=1 Tax=Streptomyces sp. NPDC058301 TaxID=3346436 RepID=UPI0036EA3542